jgi:hypothetical protein
MMIRTCIKCDRKKCHNGKDLQKNVMLVRTHNEYDADKNSNYV